jgi:GNAT superfamily N-acetyltransferase
MFIREATPDDNTQLQQLQAQCPQGTSLVVSTVNTPDFFARAKAYEAYKVYVVCEDNSIIASAACAIRNGMVNGAMSRVGYEFQYFTSPHHRQKGLARQLRQRVEAYLTEHGAVLSYALIMEGNLPSMRLFEGQGFKPHRALVMPALAVQKEMTVPPAGKVRTAQPEDLAAVSRLLNDMWQGRELFEPTTPETIAQFLRRTPALSSDNLLVLEDQGSIVACLGYWDWSQVMRITVLALSQKLRLIGQMLVVTRVLPRFPKPGDTINQMMLTLVGFTDPAQLATLIRHLNNLALQKGTEQIFCIGQPGDTLLKSTKGFIRVDTAIHLYIKPLQPNVSLAGGPVFIDGIDL